MSAISKPSPTYQRNSPADTTPPQSRRPVREESVIYENVDEDSKSSEDNQQSPQQLIEPPANTRDASPQHTSPYSKPIKSDASKINNHHRPVPKTQPKLVNKNQLDSQCTFSFLVEFYSN